MLVLALHYCQAYIIDMNNPERFMSEPGCPEKQTRIDSFFDRVLGLTDFDDDARKLFCEIRSREITIDAESDSYTPHLSDDRITELSAKGRTIAMAIEIRDDFNYTQVYLAHYVTKALLSEIGTQLH